jgi:hypothetical protein
MSLYDLFQYGVIAVAVIFSLRYLLQKFGVLKAKRGKPTHGGSCDDGCGGCKGCSAVSALKSQLPKS